MRLENLSRNMKEIDFAMLATHVGGGVIKSRPMRNNLEVDYNGKAWLSQARPRSLCRIS